MSKPKCDSRGPRGGRPGRGDNARRELPLDPAGGGRAEELKDIQLKWLEEPIWPPENYDGLAQLRKVCGIPIAAGENSSTLL
jgi:Enolase C-terminal domain-like